MIFRDREGREVGDLVGERTGWGGRTRSVKIRRSSRETGEARRGKRGEEDERRVEREDGRWFGREKEGSEGEKGRATSARSRATIGDHLPSWAALVLDLSGGGSEGEKSTTSCFAAAAAAIIKLFTHTERYLSSKQRDHNVLLFDPHFVSDLSLTASRDDMYLADPACPIWSTSHDLARQLLSVGERIASDNITSRVVISNRIVVRIYVYALNRNTLRMICRDFACRLRRFKTDAGDTSPLKIDLL